MTTKTLLLGLKFVTLIAIVAVILIILKISPYQNQDPNQRVWPNIIALNAGLFVALAGIFSLVFYWLRKKALGVDIMKIHLGVSLRQGILFSLCIIIILVLQSFRLLTWWDGLLVAGAIFLIELYFLAR